ncbi:hypothetical protein [Nonomuraea africana]
MIRRDRLAGPGIDRPAEDAGLVEETLRRRLGQAHEAFRHLDC